jgi:hypothetical protein
MKKYLILLIICNIIIVSCVSYTPPEKVPIQNNKNYILNYDTIWNKIHEWIVKNDFKLKDHDKTQLFVNELGIKRQSIEYYKDKDYLSNELKLKLKELGINPDWVETGEGEMFLFKNPILKQETENIKQEDEKNILKLTDPSVNYITTKECYEKNEKLEQEIEKMKMDIEARDALIKNLKSENKDLKTQIELGVKISMLPTD